MKKIWSDEAWDDYVYWQNQDNHCQAILRDFGVYVLMQKIELYFE